MATLNKVFAILFFVLPALILANACQVSVVSTLIPSDEQFDTYKTVIINLGDVAVENLILTTSGDVLDVDGLEAIEGGYVMPSDATIEVDDVYTFKYTVESGKTVTWSEKCSSMSERSKSSKKATKAPTAAPTHKTTTTTKKPSTTTTTKKPSTTTTTKPSGSTTTQKPSNSASGRKCPTGTWWAPAPSTTWQWQLEGTIDQSVNVQMYDIDMFDNTAATVSSLHAAGRVVICYFSTQYENWRPDASSFTSAVIGKGLDGWAGENYVDIRSTVVRNIMAARLDHAATMGCDGVEPDNVDGYTASSGFPLTAADQLSFNEFLATQAHARGLSVGLKNDIDQAAALVSYFDWALNEQCYEYSECASLNTFISHGKAVFNAEYSGTASKVCPYMVGLKFSSLIKTLDLTASIKAQCCTYATGGCASAAYTCVSTSSSLIEDNAPTLETVPVVEQEFVASATTTYASLLFVVVAALAVAL